MSVIYTDSVDVVKREIDKLLEQQLHISGDYFKTYRLYGTDNKLLLSVEKYKKDCTGAEYSIRLDNFNFKETISLQPNWRIENFYTMVKPFFDAKHANLKPIDGLTFTSEDATRFYQEYKEYKDYRQDRFISNLIANLYKVRCPIDCIEKIIYYFDRPNSKHKFPNQFEALNHDNKLVEYKTPRGNIWFFVGENYHLNFTPMNEETLAIFDNVKIAFKKQKQK